MMAIPPRLTAWTRYLACALLAAMAQGATPRFARLASFEGPVEVQLDAAETWRPAMLNLPLPEATRIRTGPAAKVEIELDDGSVFRMTGEGLAELSDYTRLSGGQRIAVISLDRGLAYFTGDPGPGDAIDLLVPGAQAALKQGSRIRLESLENSSEIAIIEGAVHFTIPAADMDLRQGQSARVTVPESTHFSLYREISPLESDRWSEQLDRAESQKPASSLDLDRGGKWIDDGDYGTIWQPAPQAGWAPFRDGRWIWLQSVGFTWVGAEPWGWRPYHEGRWLQHRSLGWVWVPGAQDSSFSPGDVFWARGTNLALWGPLAPGEQWNGTGPPRQFAAFNVTGGTFVSGTREILPSSADDLPKDLLKSFLFTAALPSPPLTLARLNALRDTLRTRLFTAVEVTPEAPVVTEAVPATPPADSEPAPVVAAAVPPPPEPVIAPDQPADLPPVTVVPGIVAIAGSGGKSPAPKTNPPNAAQLVPRPPAPAPGALLNGAGGAEPAALYEHWFHEFKEALIAYQAGGGGLRELRQGRIDFLATDMAPAVGQTNAGQTNAGQTHGSQARDAWFAPLYFPTAVDAVVATYNVPGLIGALRLTPELLAGIYLGEISYWNDPRMVAANPLASLPAANIVLVNRSDASATTYTWTAYLSQVSAKWKSSVGAAKSVTWPVAGLMGAGNEGVAGLVVRTPYSLGFVDFAWAGNNRVPCAEVRNRSGAFVGASTASLSAAATNASPGLREAISDAPGRDSYPIAAYTYLLVPRQFADAHKRTVMTDFLKWMMSSGQKENAGYGFGALPAAIVSMEKQQLSLFQ